MYKIAYRMRYAHTLSGLLIGFMMFLSFSLSAQQQDDKTCSPYFFVKSDDVNLEQFPLKSTDVQVDVAGVVANVSVKQKYCNTGKKTLEAIYVFPASTRAAVHFMQMKIGERTITAQVKEKGQARKDYENAKKQGKSASLLEQDRPNVFTMNVANILPGDTIEIELIYTELLVPTDGVYEFVYPTVVGPRYTGSSDLLASADKNWVSNPYTAEGVKPAYTIDLNMNLNTGIPIKDLKCESHKVNINYLDKQRVELKLDEKTGGNKDLIIKYRLKGENIETGTLLFAGKEENFFMTMVQPPKRPKAESVPSKEYIFVIDVSGSMSGFPLDVSKKLMRELLSNLRPEDKFNLVLFAGAANQWKESSVAATKDNISLALGYIGSRSGGGGTELLYGLKKAFQIKKQDGYSRTFVIATDGYIRVEKECFDFIRQNLGQANFFAFGIGSSPNRFLIEGIANVGMGEPFVATNESDALLKAEKFRKYVSTPVLTDIKIDIQGIEVYDVEPLNVPDVFAERPIIIYGKYHGEPNGTIKVTGTSGNSEYTKIMQLGTKNESVNNAALKYIWARNKIRLLDDYTLTNNPDHAGIKSEVLKLGLKYNLLTKYTSFIAVDNVSRTEEEAVTVKQPLPLPKGVSNKAVMKNSYSSSSRSSSSSQNFNTVDACEVLEFCEIEIVDVFEEEEAIEVIPFSIAETQPLFPDGDRALMEFIASNINYPQEAKDAGIQGTVYIQFTIDVDGSIIDVKVIRSVDPRLDEEAVRLIKSFPNWSPGTQRGKPVKVQYMLPIRFVLNN